MRKLLRASPDVSVIVVAYDMDRELPRTLESLSPGYQRDAADIDYEVLVVDNGSPEPFGAERVRRFGDRFRYMYLRNPPPSPAYALNRGVQAARGGVVCLMIDGARMLTPGVLSLATAAFRAYRNPTISVLGWHLGPDLQNRSIAAGYDQAREDALLQGIAWPEDGYRLFEISVLAGSCAGGWFKPVAESNAVFLTKDAYLHLGGFDERFDSPGGGFVNLDFYRRAVLREDSELLLLLGEGSFHQIHGGVAANASAQVFARKMEEWQAQYRALRGEDFRIPEKRPVYLGSLAPSAMPSVADAARNAAAQRV